MDKRGIDMRRICVAETTNFFKQVAFLVTGWNLKWQTPGGSVKFQGYPDMAL